MSKQRAKEREPGTRTQENPDVVVVRAATAPKLSPRGEGGIDYQVGLLGNSVQIRIEKNHGGGSCSKEWVALDRIRAAITPAMRRGESFKSDALAGAFVGRSQCNSGFLVACLRREALFSESPNRKGMNRLTGDLDAWESAMREAAPVLGEGGQPVTVKLHPDPKETRFRPKQADGGSAQPRDNTAQDGGASPAPEGGPPTPASDDAAGERKPILRKVRRVKPSKDGATPGPDGPDPSMHAVEPDPDGEPVPQIEASETAVA